MKTVLNISVATFLLMAVSGPCFALWDPVNVSKEEAKKLGMEVRSTAAGSKHVRVELEFKLDDKLKDFSQVDLQFDQGDKPTLTAALREDRSKPGRVAVSFTVDTTQLDKLTLRLMVPFRDGGAGGTIYHLQVKDFVELTKDRAAEKAKEGELQVLIDKVLEAHGGEDKLSKLQFTMTVKHSNGYTNHYFVQPPKNFRWETTHPDQTGKGIVILFPEGRRWWTKEPGGAAREFIPTGIEPLSVEGWFDYVKFFGPRQVLRLKDADHKVTLRDEEAKIGGRAAVGVQVTGPHYDHKMYFDKETHLLLKGVGSDILREVTYGDYKKFDAIPIAQKEHDGHFEPEVTDFRAVDKFDDKLFEQP